MEQFTDPQFNRDFTQQYSLLIELELQQLAFVLYNSSNGRIAVLKRISMSSFSGGTDAVAAFKKVVNAEDLLHVPVKDVKISFVWNAFTCIPHTMYDEALKEQYLTYAAGSLPHHITAVNYIRPFFIRNVFAVEAALQAYLLQTFPAAVFFHVSTSLLEYAALSKDEKGPAQLILDVRQDLIHLVYISKGELQYCNQFHFKNKEDFLYFILLVCDQLEIDRDNCNLQLSGYITQDSALYNELYKFFRNISFAAVQEHFKISELGPDIAVHYFNTLLNLHLCA